MLSQASAGNYRGTGLLSAAGSDHFGGTGCCACSASAAVVLQRGPDVRAADPVRIIGSGGGVSGALKLRPVRYAHLAILLFANELA
jgi:hypothetical protein